MSEPSSRIKVTVYMPSHSYGRFLREAVQSVLAQNFSNWELLIIDDGSTDETAEIAAEYARAMPERIRVFRNEEAQGLAACSNLALGEARGEYVMRLDSDDMLDESALLVMSAFLDANPDVALVYPNYTYVDEFGRFLAIESRKKIGLESHLLDLPAHGACTMVRRRVLKAVGGYASKYRSQDGYELWLKLHRRFKVANIGTPLFAYRQHGTSITRDENKILGTRQRIKRDLVERERGEVAPRVIAVVPAKNTYRHLENIVLRQCGGRPLIDYTLDAALNTPDVELVVVTTDDPEVVAYCEGRDKVVVHFRPPELSSSHVSLSQVLVEVLAWIEQEHRIHADIVALLSVHSPLRRWEHVRKALDTLLLYDTDSVISVYEDFDLHFTHGAHGLEALNPSALRKVRLEREALYVDNGAVKVVWRDLVQPDDMTGRRVGHIVMRRADSLQIKDERDVQIVDRLLTDMPSAAGSAAAVR